MLTTRRLIWTLLAAVVLFLVLGSFWSDWQRPMPLPRLISAPTPTPRGGQGLPSLPPPGVYPPPLPTMPSGVYPPPTFAPPTPAAYPSPLAPSLTSNPTPSRGEGGQTPLASPTLTPAPSPLVGEGGQTPTPTLTDTATATPGPSVTATLRPVTAAEIAQPVFIESLRRKVSGAGDIEIMRVWAERPTFTRSTMRYTSEGQRVTGYINIPKGAGPFPAIVMNHGYFLQERYTPGLGTLREADYLAEQGYVVAVSDFRSYAGSDKGVDGGGHFGVDWVYDSMNLMDAIKRLPQVDANRLGVWGHSTGGLNALQSTVSRQDIRATVVVSTMSADMTQTLGFLRNWRPWVADEVVRRFGAPQAKPENWARMSPINYLAEASGPIQIHHGTDDEEVTPEFSTRLWNAMQSAGAEGEYYIYIGVDHLWTPVGPWRQMMERTVAFYDRYLK